MNPTMTRLAIGIATAATCLTPEVRVSVRRRDLP
jgi:hypothetical protein